jgi:hypothetical protein
LRRTVGRMIPLNIDDAMLTIIVTGVVLAILYIFFEVATWRSHRLADIKYISNMRELYRRSFAHARRLVPLKFTKRKS